MRPQFKIQRGEWKGRKLTSPEGTDIRPMGARLRCKLFDSLMGELDGMLVFDVCCGTGALGLEAMSSGAARVVFVDRSQRALKLAKENVGHCNEDAVADCEFRKSPADRCLEDLAVSGGGEEPLALFVSPPYGTTVEICQAACRAYVGMIQRRSAPAYLILQHPPRHSYDLPPLPEGYVIRKKVFAAGDSQATLFRFEGLDDPA